MALTSDDHLSPFPTTTFFDLDFNGHIRITRTHHLAIRQSRNSQLLQRIIGVREELPNEDFLLRIEGMDDQ